MRTWYASAVLLALAASTAAADPPAPPPAASLEISGSLTVEVGKKCVLTAQTTAKKVTWLAPPGVDVMPLDGRRLACWAPPGSYVLRAMVPNGEDVVSAEVVLQVTGPRPPPVPPLPDPIIPDPIIPPAPAASFRVIFVYESGDTIPRELAAVMDAKIVRDYLTASTTREGNTAGWRQYDPQQVLTNETPTFKALWEKVKPKLTTLPCVVIERNGKAEILPFPVSAAAAVTLFKQYQGK